MEHSGIWVLAEQYAGKVQRISFELLTRGLELKKKRNCELSAVIFGHDLPDSELQPLLDCGADKVYVMESPLFAHFLVEPWAASFQSLVDEQRPEIIIAGATSTGRTLMPYVAMKMRCGLTADCTELDIEPETNNLLQTRPAIGGNIMATIKTPDLRPQIATIRPHSTKPATPARTGKGEIVRKTTDDNLSLGGIKRIGFTPNEEELSIQDAERVVVVGRGIKKAENIQLIRDFANSLNAALGASREVVDRGWLSYSHQIGLSGKTISPKLYIGIGVSGAIQHLAGMQTAEKIVAINSDSDAQIFKVADFGIVGDLFEVVPALIKRKSRVSLDSPV